MLERRLSSKEENKREEKERGKKRRSEGGVIKVGGANTWSRDNSYATGRCVVRQPVKVPCTVPCNAPATFYATFYDTYGGKPATLQYDQLPDRDTKLIIQYEKEQTQDSLRTVFLRTCISPHLDSTEE